jgi:ATP-binding cassette, subfamily B, multidrug efflux pump
VMVCIVGAVLVVNGQITIGVIVAFMVYIRLFTQPLTQLAQAATSLQSTAAASERVFEFLEEPLDESQEHGVALPSQVKGEVIFDHVSFGYHANQMIIRDFTLHVKAGQKIAIVGPTGAGKTTLVNLLMRFYEVNSGDIFIDGISIQALSKEAVHDLFCMVLQDTWLFEGTIYDNIAYVKENVGIEAVMEAAKAVGIHRTIQALPNGYETILTDQVNLSVGQKQLITIARAMMNDAPLLILDEATSSVDTRTEVQIQQAMDKLSQGKTSFVIAHRLSTIRNADVIIVMKDGDILETGSHEQLIAQQGFYEKLYNSQFEEATHD